MLFRSDAEEEEDSAGAGEEPDGASSTPKAQAAGAATEAHTARLRRSLLELGRKYRQEPNDLRRKVRPDPPEATEEAPKARNVFHDLELSDGLQVVVGGFAAEPTYHFSKELDPMLGDLVATLLSTEAEAANDTKIKERFQHVQMIEQVGVSLRMLFHCFRSS